MLFQAETLTVEKDADGSAFLKFDVPGRAVNVVTRELLRDLDAACDRLEREKALPVLTVRSGKNTGFLAGADLRLLRDVRDEAAARELARLGQETFDRLARLPCPTVAAISGACLGGGLELALACDYRLVFDRPGTQLGLPEVELGLIPDWGGIERLPRVVGLERALLMILAGKRLSGAEAFHWGLADALARSENELRLRFAELVKRAVTQGKRQLQRPERRSWRQWLLESTTFGRKVLLRASERVLTRKTPDDMPAPREAFDALSAGALQGPDAGKARAAEAAGRLVTSPACRHLVGLFLARDAARKLPAELAKADNQAVQRVGVVGAGPLGAAVVQLAAIRGADVVVQAANAEALGEGLLRVQQLFQKAIERRVLTQEEALKRLAAVKGVLDWGGFESAQVVVEAADAGLDEKQRLFRELETRTRADCVLATASPVRVADLAGAVSRPERVAGFHLLPPVHKVPLVEVVHTPQTSPQAVARLMTWAIALGKTPTRVKDGPGFVVRRVVGPYFREAMQLVAEGLAIAAIDDELRRFGMAAGPLELLDAMGLDTAESGEPFDRMRANGWLGVESGKGFYVHGGKKPTPNRLAENLLRQGQPPSPLANLSLAARRADARERLVFLTVNAAAGCVADGLTTTPDEVDLALILGAGWAPHRGGPLHYVEDVGPAAVVAKLRGLAQRLGPRFEPDAELLRRAGV